MKSCSVDGCDGGYYALGYCEKHWRRVKKHGSPDDNTNTHGPLEQRFWRKVDKRGENECWEWIGNKKPNGYGSIQEAGQSSKTLLAHRVSYELNVGVIPEGLLIRHTCDNRKCVNPKHLILGTQSDNILDAVRRGRWESAKDRLPHFAGAAHPHAISLDIARAIKADTGTQTVLSRKYKVDRTVVKAIQTGTHWSCRE